MKNINYNQILIGIIAGVCLTGWFIWIFVPVELPLVWYNVLTCVTMFTTLIITSIVVFASLPDEKPEGHQIKYLTRREKKEYHREY